VYPHEFIGEFTYKDGEIMSFKNLKDWNKGAPKDSTSGAFFISSNMLYLLSG